MRRTRMSKPMFLQMKKELHVSVNKIATISFRGGNLRVYLEEDYVVTVEEEYKEKIIKFLKENTLT